MGIIIFGVVALIIYAVITLIQFHLSTVRLEKRIRREKQRDADKLEAERKYGRA